MNLYIFLKFLHVVVVVGAVGGAVTYSIWLIRAARDRQHLGFALAGVKALDDFIGNPGFGLLALLGIAMVIVGGLPLTTFWVLAAIVLWAVLVAVRMAVLGPSLRRQIEILAEGAAGSQEHMAQIRRFRIVGPILGLLSLVIIFVMVVKPVF